MRCAVEHPSGVFFNLPLIINKQIQRSRRHAGIKSKAYRADDAYFTFGWFQDGHIRRQICALSLCELSTYHIDTRT